MSSKIKLFDGSKISLVLLGIFFASSVNFSAAIATVGFQGLGDLPGGDFHSSARSISANGSVVVGRSTSASGNEAFRWTSSGGMVGLGDLPGGYFASCAYSVSADGSVIVGEGQATERTEAFGWENDVMTGLGDLPNGGFYSEAWSVSADGSVVVGESVSTSGDEAFRWEGGGMIGLGGPVRWRVREQSVWRLGRRLSHRGNELLSLGT
jgi:probable HAF family extracellular repeat protein